MASQCLDLPGRCRPSLVGHVGRLGLQVRDLEQSDQDMLKIELNGLEL
jgi:hypothetical protein